MNKEEFKFRFAKVNLLFTGSTIFFTAWYLISHFVLFLIIAVGLSSILAVVDIAVALKHFFGDKCYTGE